MKRIISILLIAAVLTSMLVIGSVSTSAASSSQAIAVTKAQMGKNGVVSVSWKALSYCKYYRVFYKLDNSGWVKAADVASNSQGRYYAGQVMNKKITVPLYRMNSGNGGEWRWIYVTVRGMDRDKKYNTSFKTYLAYFSSLNSFAPKMYLQNLDGGKATFTVYDPQNIDNSTKFRIFYRRGNSWKAIGDFNKNNFNNRVAIATLNVPLYKYNYQARFTVRGVNNSGQYTTPFLNDAVAENSPDIGTYQLYKIIAG